MFKKNIKINNNNKRAASVTVANASIGTIQDHVNLRGHETANVMIV